MLTLTADFNAVTGGLVRGLCEDLHGGEPTPGALVLLCDGEENEALGAVQESRDGLVFATVVWDTLSPAGAFKYWASLPVLDQLNGRLLKVTGDVRPFARSDTSISARFGGIAERLIPAPVGA